MAKMSCWSWIVPVGPIYRDEHGEPAQRFRIRLGHPLTWWYVALGWSRGLKERWR